MIGKQIKHYRIDSVIGDGGMGTVYLGSDLNLDRPVAMKVLHPQLMREAELRERFKAEAMIQAKLNHPNIVSVYDFDMETGAIIMEYVPGKSLDEVIAKESGPMPYAKCLEIFGQILKAMSYAHGFRDPRVPEGVVHRDIKPSNIMIVQHGSHTVAKVMDFGIARIVGDAKRRTATGAKMGTLWYMSPEQLKSSKDAGPRSDVYSLGVTLFEMATGKVPFDADSEYDIMSKIINSPPPPPSTIYPGVTPAFEQVICRAMSKNLSERFVDCDDFLHALTAVGEGSSGIDLRTQPIRSTPVPVPLNQPFAQRQTAQPAPAKTPTPRPSFPQPVGNIRDHLTRSLIIMMLSANPFGIIMGIIAVIFSMKTRSSLEIPDYEKAFATSNNAKNWGTASIVVSAVFWVLILIMAL